MRFVRWLAVLAAALPVAATPPTAARALSCVYPLDRLHNMEVVVQGTIVADPKKWWAHVQVSRYYRGFGPAALDVEFRGIGDSYHWAKSPPHGQEVLIELRQDQRGFYHGPCDLLMPLQPETEEVRQALVELGPGRAPDPLPTPMPAPTPAGRPTPMAEWLLLGAGGTGIAAYLLYTCRGKRQR